MKCMRRRTDCEPVSQFVSSDESTFVCCGRNDSTTRKYEQDIFTHCWKSEDTDDMSHMDVRDLLHTIVVLSMGLAERENELALEQDDE